MPEPASSSAPASHAPSPIDHVNIVVASVERSVTFYTTVLGMQTGFQGTLEGEWIDRVTGLQGVKARCIFLQSPGCAVRLELLEYGGAADPLPRSGLPQTPGIRHMAFVVEDIDAFYRHAIENGVTFVSPPVQVPFPLPGGVRKRLCYFHDPDGVLLEAAEYRQPEAE